jgi:SAM-dependent methyltransferase
MIARAVKTAGSARVSFRCGDFFSLDLPAAGFGCVVSSAALHHMPAEAAVARMAALLGPGGRLIVHDLRRDANVGDMCKAAIAAAHELTGRFVRTGWPVSSMKLRKLWRRHGKGETYLSLAEANALAARVLPGARVVNHWLWRYTIVWDKPAG